MRLIAALFAVTLFVPLFALGYTITLSPALQKEIHQANTSLANQTIPSKRTLSRGMSGADVLVLQKTLASLKLLSAEPTGYFGSLTEAAVKSFQAQQGIVSQGSVATTGYGAV